MLVEGCIETTNLLELFDLPVTFGLDTADRFADRLLDHRITFQTNCPVASIFKVEAKSYCHLCAVTNHVKRPSLFLVFDIQSMFKR